MSRHTPGPWVRDQYGTIKTPSGETLRVTGVAMPCGGRPVDFEEVDANSDLLTAAPALLSLLKEINDALYCDDFGNWCLPNNFDARQLDEVIAKATRTAA